MYRYFCVYMLICIYVYILMFSMIFLICFLSFYASANFFTASDSMITLPASEIGKVILSSATETPGIGDALKLYEYNRPIGILKLQTGEVGIGFQRVEGQSPQTSLERLKKWIMEPKQ